MLMCSSAAAQDLYVSARDYSGGKVLRFTWDGLRSTFASGPSALQGLAMDSAGNLFVADVVRGDPSVSFQPISRVKSRDQDKSRAERSLGRQSTTGIRREFRLGIAGATYDLFNKNLSSPGHGIHQREGRSLRGRAAEIGECQKIALRGSSFGSVLVYMATRCLPSPAHAQIPVL
jgi:hypothetical protein